MTLQSCKKTRSNGKMKRILMTIVTTTALLGITPTADAIDGEAILRQVDRNLNPESYEMYRKLINIEPDGSKKEFILYMIKKGQDKMVALSARREEARYAWMTTCGSTCPTSASPFASPACSRLSEECSTTPTS
jgi:hypothetical protein